MKKQHIALPYEWERWESTQSDIAHADTAWLTRSLFEIALIREFEKATLFLKEQGCVNGPLHTCVGQEPNAVAAISALLPSDKAIGTHRAHHLFLCKLLQQALPPNWAPLRDAFPPEGHEVLHRTLGEIMGLAIGYCGGWGGSMHLRHEASGFVASVGIVGAGLPLAAGVAFAEQSCDTHSVVCCFLGDGATNQGVFHEVANLAAVWRLPLILFIENNLYAEATSTSESCASLDLSGRAVAYGIPGYIVNGSDPVAIHAAVGHAAKRVRNGDGPCIIESKCYRQLEHTGGLPGSAFGYRSAGEEREWIEWDPLRTLPTLPVVGIADADSKRLLAMASECVQRAVQSCTVTTSGRYQAHPSLQPDPHTVIPALCSLGNEPSRPAPCDESGVGLSGTTKTFRETIAATLIRNLEEHADAFLLGEDVNYRGSILDGFLDRLPGHIRSRIRNTPISEAAFVGLAGGAAMVGMRPIVELLYSDFCLVAADQLFNQIARARQILGGTLRMPVVVRMRVATGLGLGGHHSTSPVALFSVFPGWHVVAPATPVDYVGLFNAAMVSQSPVLVIEYCSMYDREFPSPSVLDYHIPLGKASVIQEGEDITLFSYGETLALCQDARVALREDGITAEIVDLRTVSPSHIDMRTLGESLRKTKVGIIAERAPASQCIGRQIVAELQHCDGETTCYPVQCLSSLDLPSPASRVLEEAVMLTSNHIRTAALTAVGDHGHRWASRVRVRARSCAEFMRDR